MARTPWFERKFSMAIPACDAAETVERLRGAPARVEEAVRGYPAGILIRRPGDTWSIQENVGHLLDLEPLWAMRSEQILAGDPGMAAADLENTKTHEADHNSAEIGSLLAGFRAAREAWVARLDGLAESDFSASLVHPRLNEPMRLVDLCEFVATHDDYHLARMREVAAEVG